MSKKNHSLKKTKGDVMKVTKTRPDYSVWRGAKRSKGREGQKARIIKEEEIMN